MPNYDDMRRRATGAAVNPGQVDQLMGALRAGQGRGSQYGYQMSQRPPPSPERNISNAPPVPGPGMTSRPDYAGRQFSRVTGIDGLSGGREMELMQNGYTDIGNVRYILDRSTGQVSQMPRPGSGFGHDLPPGHYGAQDPVSLMEAIRRGNGG